MATPNVNPKMEYRRLGNSGLKVSVLSFGSWVTFDTQLDNNLAVECMAAAGDAGCNFFDNAEAYAGGKSEEIMGHALRELGWPRWTYVLTTKIFWGIHGDVPNMRNTTNRKYLMQAIDGSLERFQHRLRRRALLPPLRSRHADGGDGVGDERHRVVRQGAVLGHQRVVGRRDPSCHRDRRASSPAQADHRAEPVQPARAAQGGDGSTPACRPTSSYGNTIWSPLASGLLTGKYHDGIPEDSRGALDGYGWLADRLTDADAIARVEKLRPIADRLGCTMAQLALAWCTKNPNVSTVITGASKVSQVVQNFETVDVIPLLTDEVKEEMEAAVKK